MSHECDVLIIGGGGAGVRAAVEAAGAGAGVILADKGRFERSGTSPLGLHGFSSVLGEDDSEDILISDIILTGCLINDQDLVRAAVQETRIEPGLLEKMGVRFIRNDDGGYYIYKGAGHSVPHNVVFDEKGNGINFVSVMGKEAWKRGVRLIDGIMTTDLLVEEGRVTGAIGVDTERRIHVFAAGAVVLAAGGANRIYPNVVPRISSEMYRTTGDGYALALKAGLSLVDMEFANFRDSPPATSFGGTYMNASGERFMARYEPIRREQAPRGKVVEAIFSEIQAGNGPVYIEVDLRKEKTVESLPEEYRTYFKAYKEGKRPPVSITFQRLLGGARIRHDASTEIEGLFVAGENAGGFHGADRLQGAAFLETQVFGRLAGTGAARFARIAKKKAPAPSLLDIKRKAIMRILESGGGKKASEIMENAQSLMWNHASIIREKEGLEQALEEIQLLRRDLNAASGRTTFELFEAMNLALASEMVIRSALAREETRGTHRRRDFPGMREDMAYKHICLRSDPDGAIRASLVQSRR